MNLLIFSHKMAWKRPISGVHSWEGFITRPKARVYEIEGVLPFKEGASVQQADLQ